MFGVMNFPVNPVYTFQGIKGDKQVNNLICLNIICNLTAWIKPYM